jgi:hypothetical protein
MACQDCKLRLNVTLIRVIAWAAMLLPIAALGEEPVKAKVDSQASGDCWSTIAISSSGSPSELSSDVTFEADVNMALFCGRQMGGCGGTVVFYDHLSPLGQGSVNGRCVATFDTSALTVGRHLITATFFPPNGYNDSHAFLWQIVDGWVTTTMLSSDADPSSYGQTVAVTAAVTSDTGLLCTGMVRFSENGIPIRTATLTPNLDDGDAVATMTKRNLGSGSDAITAEYFGDSQCARSTGTLQQVVDPASTTLTLSSSPNPSQAGQNVTLSARVISANGARAIGTVTFTADTVTIGTVALSGNLARISTDALPAGPHSITATYNGGGNFVTSSATLTQNVK